MNLTVLRGRLSRPPSTRELPSGTRLTSIDLTTPGTEEAPADSVPVIMRSAPLPIERLDTDDEVLVVGKVRRRFFRSGGMTQSRTEVEAQAIIRVSDSQQVQEALLGCSTQVLTELHDATERIVGPGGSYVNHNISQR